MRSAVATTPRCCMPAARSATLMETDGKLREDWDKLVRKLRVNDWYAVGMGTSFGGQAVDSFDRAGRKSCPQLVRAAAGRFVPTGFGTAINV